jgi:hypothetical protein
MMFGGLIGRAIGHGIGKIVGLDEDDTRALARGLGLIGMVLSFDAAEGFLQLGDLASGADTALSGADAMLSIDPGTVDIGDGVDYSSSAEGAHHDVQFSGYHGCSCGCPAFIYGSGTPDICLGCRHGYGMHGS